jgi:hypothetical protein
MHQRTNFETTQKEIMLLRFEVWTLGYESSFVTNSTMPLQRYTYNFLLEAIIG